MGPQLSASPAVITRHPMHRPPDVRALSRELPAWPRSERAGTPKDGAAFKSIKIEALLDSLPVSERCRQTTALTKTSRLASTDQGIVKAAIGTCPANPHCSSSLRQFPLQRLKGQFHLAGPFYLDAPIKKAFLSSKQAKAIFPLSFP